MDKIPAPEEMRNATLSPGTKEYLVAYRKAEEAVDIVVKRVEKAWPGAIDETLEKLYEKSRDLLDEFLNLMIDEVRENLGTDDRTEI